MASNNWSTALVNYASQDPTTIPPDVYVTHNDHFTTIRDLYPKSSYHLLILPRLPFRFDDGSSLPASPSSLDSLQSFLNLKPELALEVLELLEETVGEVEEIVKKQMRDEKGWEWDVVYGFHAVPSIKHLHLHVLSKDLISPCLKNKKHYNSFSPTLGFFLYLSTVREWLENPSKYKKELLLKRDDYEPLLKGRLVSFYSPSTSSTTSSLTSTSASNRATARHSSSPELSSDDNPLSSSTTAKKGAGKGTSSGASRGGEEFKTMPALKVHLEEELKKLEKRSKKS